MSKVDNTTTSVQTVGIMKTILLNLDSNSIGDTICFMPCANYFLERYDEKVLVKINPSFHRFFLESYPNIEFYKDGSNYDKEIIIKYDFTKPMQTGFAEQMGFFKWEYIRPKIDKPTGKSPFNKKFITSGIHSTAQLKYWNNPLDRKFQSVSPYWGKLFKLIKTHNYQPVVVEKDELFGVSPNWNGMPSNCLKKLGLSLDETMLWIYYSEFFIGLSSGLSWIAHALGKPVVMISNFSEDWHEIDLSIDDYIRVTNKSVCHGCWNTIGKTRDFDFKDWYWCPLHKNTKRQFECHYSITPEYVYEKIKKWLK